jgi:hypothetical protein
MFAEMPLDNLNGGQIRPLPPLLAFPAASDVSTSKRFIISSWWTVL